VHVAFLWPKATRSKSSRYVTELLMVRPHRLHRCGLYLIATDVVRSVVCVSVFCAYGWAVRKNGWSDRDAVWGTDSRGPKESCIRWGWDPSQEEAILGVVRLAVCRDN